MYGIFAYLWHAIGREELTVDKCCEPDENVHLDGMICRLPHFSSFCDCFTSCSCFYHSTCVKWHVEEVQYLCIGQRSFSLECNLLYRPYIMCSLRTSRSLKHIALLYSCQIVVYYVSFNAHISMKNEFWTIQWAILQNL